MSQPAREQRVSDAFVALADTLVDDYDIIDLLDQLVAHCVSLLAADAAGLLLADPRGELRPVAASSEDAQTMELLQLQAEEGPCLECYQTAAQVRIPDLARMADRWPRFTAAAAEAGAFVSVHAIPLRLRGQAIGALNLFHATPGPLPEVDLALGQALADVATIGILQERAIRHREVLSEQLQTALNRPRDHRTGQGCASPAARGADGHRVRPAAPLRPRQQPALGRGSPPVRHQRVEPGGAFPGHLAQRHRHFHLARRTENPRNPGSPGQRGAVLVVETMNRSGRDLDDHIRRLDHRHRQHTRLQAQVVDRLTTDQRHHPVRTALHLHLRHHLVDLNIGHKAH